MRCWWRGQPIRHCLKIILKKTGHRIRVATPRHNGKVERQHRLDEKRFYGKMRMYSLEDGQKQLKKYNRISNNISKCCLNYRSPQEVLEDYMAVMWAADFACFEEPRRRKIRKIFDKSTYIIFFLRKVSPIIDDCTRCVFASTNFHLTISSKSAIIPLSMFSV